MITRCKYLQSRLPALHICITSQRIQDLIIRNSSLAASLGHLHLSSARDPIVSHSSRPSLAGVTPGSTSIGAFQLRAGRCLFTEIASVAINSTNKRGMTSSIPRTANIEVRHGSSLSFVILSDFRNDCSGDLAAVAASSQCSGSSNCCVGVREVAASRDLANRPSRGRETRKKADCTAYREYRDHGSYLGPVRGLISQSDASDTPSVKIQLSLKAPFAVLGKRGASRSSHPLISSRQSHRELVRSTSTSSVR